MQFKNIKELIFSLDSGAISERIIRIRLYMNPRIWIRLKKNLYEWVGVRFPYSGMEGIDVRALLLLAYQIRIKKRKFCKRKTAHIGCNTHEICSCLQFRNRGNIFSLDTVTISKNTYYSKPSVFESVDLVPPEKICIGWCTVFPVFRCGGDKRPRTYSKRPLTPGPLILPAEEVG